MDETVNAFKRLLKETGLTQLDVAIRSGETSSTVSRFANGGDIAASKAKNIAVALGCSVDELLGIDQEGFQDDEARLMSLFVMCSPKGRELVLEYAEMVSERHPKSAQGEGALTA